MIEIAQNSVPEPERRVGRLIGAERVDALRQDLDVIQRAATDMLKSGCWQTGEMAAWSSVQRTASRVGALRVDVDPPPTGPGVSRD